MTDDALLARLWNTYTHRNFRLDAIDRDLSLNRDEALKAIQQIEALKDKPPQNGLKLKSIGGGFFKVIRSAQNDGDTPKGLPLTGQNEAVTGEVCVGFSDRSAENSQNAPDNADAGKIRGLLLPIRERKGKTVGIIKTAGDKNASGGSNLWGWQYEARLPQEWIRLLNQGRVIVPGAFEKTESETKGHYRYSHRKGGWRGASLIICDGDVIKGVEFDDEGNDKNPTGIEAFTDPQTLFELLPNLDKEAYAIGHSVNSLSTEKPPPHVRTRIAFLLETPITDEQDYTWLLQGLALIYPIISAGRQPAQPVYGNAANRRTINDGKLVELDEPFTSRIFGNVLSDARVAEIIGYAETEQRQIDEEANANRDTEAGNNSGTYDGERIALTDWLNRHGVTIKGERQGPTHDNKITTMYHVKCPWEGEHTEAFGVRDTAVFVDPADNRWCFNCFHAHCEHRGWEDYRAKIAPKPPLNDRRNANPAMRMAYDINRKARYGN